MTELVSRKVMFGNPEKALVQISPDGKYLAWLAPREGVMNVWVAPKDNLESARPVTKDTKRGIPFFEWAASSKHLLYLVDESGDENWSTWVTQPEIDAGKNLTPFVGAHTTVHKVSPLYPEEVLVECNKRKAEFFDIYRLNIVTGTLTLVVENNDYAGFLSDDQFNVRVAVKVLEDGSSEQFVRSGNDDAWTKSDVIPFEDVMTTATERFDASGELLYFRDSRNRNTSAIYELNTANGEHRLVADDVRADIGHLYCHPSTGLMQAYTIDYEREEIIAVDKEFEAHLKVLRSGPRGNFNITSRTKDDLFWTVEYSADTAPATAYLYDSEQRRLTKLFSYKPTLEDAPLTKVHSTVVKARDGLDLVVYYSLPLQADPEQTGRPNKPVPMVMCPHGGPWARDHWGYDAVHQWLANRGYGVMKVNFRASTGYGKAHTNAGDLKWGEEIMWDQIDAVNWAVEQGIAQKDKVAVFGGSFGGYSVLASLTMYPDVYCCGVDIVGPSNLQTLLESIPEYWKPILNNMLAKIGDYRTEEGRALLKKHSPLTHVDNIRVPLLIGQGANDPRVKQTEADQIVTAMQQKNLPVTYVLYPDEGHGFARPENRLSFFATAEAFLAEHLDGNYQPIGNDFESSSIEVPQGVEHIAALSGMFD